MLKIFKEGLLIMQNRRLLASGVRVIMTFLSIYIEIWLSHRKPSTLGRLSLQRGFAVPGIQTI
jgi:hypothetical protein